MTFPAVAYLKEQNNISAIYVEMKTNIDENIFTSSQRMDFFSLKCTKNKQVVMQSTTPTLIRISYACIFGLEVFPSLKPPYSKIQTVSKLEPAIFGLSTIVITTQNKIIYTFTNSFRKTAYYLSLVWGDKVLFKCSM